MLDRNKAVFEIMLKDMTIKDLVLQLKLMTLVYVEICTTENVPFYCNKATGVDMQNDAVLELNSISLVKTWNSQEFKAFLLMKMNYIIH